MHVLLRNGAEESSADRLHCCDAEELIDLRAHGRDQPFRVRGSDGHRERFAAQVLGQRATAALIPIGCLSQRDASISEAKTSHPLRHDAIRLSSNAQPPM